VRTLTRWQRFLADQGFAFDARGRARAAPDQEHTRDAACVDLGDYDLAILEGKDAHAFLQGYLTCDVDALAPERALLGAFCNLQGRVVADVVLATIDGAPWLSIHSSLVAPLKDGLAKYLQFARSRFRAPDDAYVTLGLLAPLGPERLPATLLETAAYREGIAIRVPGEPARWLAIVPYAAATALWASAAAEGRIADGNAWDLADVRARWARVCAATSEAFLPQMLGLTDLGAVSFAKGCYLGQEIVARAQHLGRLKRRLALATWRGAQAPNAGEALLDGRGRPIATVIAAAQTESGTGEALAVHTAAADDAAVTASGITFTFR